MLSSTFNSTLGWSFFYIKRDKNISLTEKSTLRNIRWESEIYFKASFILRSFFNGFLFLLTDWVRFLYTEQVFDYILEIFVIAISIWIPEAFEGFIYLFLYSIFFSFIADDCASGDWTLDHDLGHISSRGYHCPSKEEMQSA